MEPSKPEYMSSRDWAVILDRCDGATYYDLLDKFKITSFRYLANLFERNAPKITEIIKGRLVGSVCRLLRETNLSNRQISLRLPYTKEDISLQKRLLRIYDRALKDMGLSEERLKEERDNVVGSRKNSQGGKVMPKSSNPRYCAICGGELPKGRWYYHARCQPPDWLVDKEFISDQTPY